MALCSVWEIKGDTGGAGGKAEGDRRQHAFLEDLALKEHVWGAALRLGAAVTSLGGLFSFPRASSASYSHLKLLQ